MADKPSIDRANLNGDMRMGYKQADSFSHNLPSIPCFELRLPAAKYKALLLFGTHLDDMEPLRKNDHDSSFDAIMPPRKEKAKRSSNNSADRPVLEQQQACFGRGFGNRCAADGVETRRKTRSSSNARQVERLPNAQVVRMENQATKWTGRPSPKRGDVTRKIIKEAVDSAYGFCFSSPASNLEVDAFLEEVLFPTKSQPMATLQYKALLLVGTHTLAGNMESLGKNNHDSSFDAIMLPRKEKAKRSSNNSAVVEQQACFGNRCAAGAVKTRRKTRSSSNARQVERLPNAQVVFRMENQATKWTGRPSPKRGDVARKIIKEVVDSACGFCCSSPASNLEVDAFLEEVPFPTKSQAMATLWPDVSA